ncbi:HotDog domain-containing protein [Mycena crocata]|nr:HotDog domain-containing protein [Mycena crocata]
MPSIAPWESFQRTLPNAPGVDVTQIRGNIPDAEKQVNANVLAYFATGSGRSPFPPFGTEIGGKLKIVELNVWDDKESASGSAESEVVLEIEVTRSMCNVYGTMHGGCAAYMLDPATVASTVLLGLAKGFDGTGVSQSMNIHWHHPAPLGSTLIITTRSVFVDGRARLARCEMRDKSTRKLIVSGSHAYLNAGRATANSKL